MGKPYGSTARAKDAAAKSRDSRPCNSAVAGTRSTQQPLETETDCLEMLPCCCVTWHWRLCSGIVFVPVACCWLMEGFRLLTGWPTDLKLRGKTT